MCETRVAAAWKALGTGWKPVSQGRVATNRSYTLRKFASESHVLHLREGDRRRLILTRRLLS
jgi:hypothetical protein